MVAGVYGEVVLPPVALASKRVAAITRHHRVVARHAQARPRKHVIMARAACRLMAVGADGAPAMRPVALATKHVAAIVRHHRVAGRRVRALLRTHVIMVRAARQSMAVGVDGEVVMRHVARATKVVAAIARHRRGVARHVQAQPRKLVIRRRVWPSAHLAQPILLGLIQLLGKVHIHLV